MAPKGSARTQADRKAVAGIKAFNRSAISNGRDVLPDIDGRRAVARRYKDICATITSDQGGLDQLSEARLQLIRRFSASCVIAEQLESRLANGDKINISEHALLCSTLARLATRIGIDRRARDITPSLSEYLDQAHSADEATT